MKSLLIFDMSFTLEMYKKRQLQQALESRTLGGYFGKVISVHPLAGLFETGNERYGNPLITKLDNSHIFVEGKVGATKYLNFLSPLNLFIAQINLVIILLKLGREQKVNVVRIGDPYYLGIMGWIISRLLKVPLAIRVCFNYDQLYEITGKAVFPKLFIFRFVEKLIERFIFPRCELVAGANQNNLDYAIANRAKPGNGVVFRYGNLISPVHFTEPNSRGECRELLTELDVKGDFIATVSRLEKMKQPEQNILVMKRLVESGFDLSFIFIGDGSMKRELEEMIEKLNLENRIVFAGNLSQEKIAKILPAARLILSPHMGRGLTEACLAGVPIVAYDYDWQREIIISGETGELVAKGDWQEMAMRAEQLLHNSTRSYQLGKKARATALEMMSPDKLESIEIASYEALFNRTIEE